MRKTRIPAAVSKVRFRRDVEEYMCGEPVTVDKLEGACMRADGHDGEHMAWACDAFAADGRCGVCFARDGHAPDCGTRETEKES